MNFNIDGEYSFIIPMQTMFINEDLRITNHNIITRQGEAFFLLRAINNNLVEPLGSIAIGNGNISPKQTDRILGNETNRKKATCNVNPDSKQIILTANFTVEELTKTSEIGVYTRNEKGEDLLISHDVYQKIDPSVLSGISGEVTVEYIYHFTSSYQKNTWNVYDEAKNIYYAYEENTVVRIFENNSGYRSASSLNELETLNGGYYQDFENKILYIRPIGDLDSGNIIVQV